MLNIKWIEKEVLEISGWQGMDGMCRRTRPYKTKSVPLVGGALILVATVFVFLLFEAKTADAESSFNWQKIVLSMKNIVELFE